MIVGDLDGDNFDDVITLGHDEDPRNAADAMIRWGGTTTDLEGAPATTVHVAIEPNAKYHELLSGQLVTSTRNPNLRELLLFSGEDAVLPPDGLPSRHHYLTEVTFAGHAIEKQVSTPDFIRAANFGGYGGDEAFVFAARTTRRRAGRCTCSSAVMRCISITACPRMSRARGSQEIHIDGRGPDEKVQGVYTAPPDPGSGRSDLFVVSTAHAALTKADDYSLAPSIDIMDDSRYSRGRLSGTELWVASAPQSVKQVDVFGVQAMTFEHATVAVDRAPIDMALDDLDADGKVELVTIDELDHVIVYGAVDLGTGSTQPAVMAAANGGSVLAVGHFGGEGDAILVYSTLNPSQAAACYHFAGGALTSC